MFEIENKQITFKRITTKDGLELIKATTFLTNEDVNTKEKGLNILNSLCLKYLVITDKEKDLELEIKGDANLLDNVFSNPLCIIEISNYFQEYIKDFLNALPSFQKATMAGR